MRNAKSLSFQQRISMRAVNYDRFTVKTFFISQSGDFIKTQEFSQTPGQEDRLMTNTTIDWDKVAPELLFTKVQWSFGPFKVDGRRWLRSKASLKF